MKFELRIVTHFRMARVRAQNCTFYYLPIGLRSWRGMVNPAIRLRVTRPQPRFMATWEIGRPLKPAADKIEPQDLSTL